MTAPDRGAERQIALASTGPSTHDAELTFPADHPMGAGQSNPIVAKIQPAIDSSAYLRHVLFQHGTSDRRDSGSDSGNGTQG